MNFLPTRSHPTGAWDLRPYAPSQIQEHLEHREENIFVQECEDCSCEFCLKCNGTGYIDGDCDCTCEAGRLW